MRSTDYSLVNIVYFTYRVVQKVSQQDFVTTASNMDRFYATSLKASAIPPTATDVTARGLSVCLSHSCTPLKPLDGMRCHLVGTQCLVPSNTVLDRGPSPPQKGEIWGVGTPSSQQCLPVAKLFCLLSKFFHWHIQQ